MTRVTLDTATVDADAMIEAGQRLGFNFVRVTVTDRELEPSDIRPHAVVGCIPETLILGESPIGSQSLMSEGDIYEELLTIISNGSFPKRDQREHLTEGQRHQLRDAMIFSAHVREGRDIFVTDDIRGFIRHGRRERLEQRFDTKIMTSTEFLGVCNGAGSERIQRQDTNNSA